MKKLLVFLLLVLSAAATFYAAATPNIRVKLLARGGDTPSILLSGASELALALHLPFSLVDKKIPGMSCELAGKYFYESNTGTTLVPPGEFPYGAPLRSERGQTGFDCSDPSTDTYLMVSSLGFTASFSRRWKKSLLIRWLNGVGEFYSRNPVQFTLQEPWGKLEIAMPLGAVIRLERYDPKQIRLIFPGTLGSQVRAIPETGSAGLGEYKVLLYSGGAEYEFIAPGKDPVKSRRVILYDRQGFTESAPSVTSVVAPPIRAR